MKLRLRIACACLLSASLAPAQAPPRYRVSTVAGGFTLPFPSDGVTVDNVRLYDPQFTATDAAGNIYLTEAYYHRLLRIAPDGAITSLAGADTPGFRGDNGPASEALLNQPAGVAVTPSGDIYIADSGNRRIRKISPEGVIATIAGNGQPGATGDGGPALNAAIGTPIGIAVDPTGNVFFSDSGNSVIRRIDVQGTITTVAGGTRGFGGDGGPATQGRLQDPRGIALDPAGNIFIADTLNNRVRIVSNGTIRTYAGTGNIGFTGDNGPAISATLSFPYDVRMGPQSSLLIADRSNGLIRRVLPTGTIQTLRPTGVTLTLPNSLTFDAQGSLIVVDDLRRLVFRVDPSNQAATVIVNGVRESGAGDGGPAIEAPLLEPFSAAVGNDGSVYVADSGDSRVRRITPDGIIQTFAGNGTPDQTGDNSAANSSAVGVPRGLLFDANGTLLISTAIQGAAIRAVDANGTLTTIAGIRAFGFAGDGGPATQATFFGVLDMAYDRAGNLYLTDTQNHRVRRIGTDGVVTTVAGTGVAGFSGDGGPAIAARLNLPSGIAVDSQDRVVIADTANNRIRRIEADGSIVTIAGNGTVGAVGDGGPATAAQVAGPRAIKYDAAGNLIIPLPLRVRLIAPDGVIHTIAGVVTTPGEDETLAIGSAVANAYAVAPAPDGSIYVVEFSGRRVRKLTPEQ